MNESEFNGAGSPPVAEGTPVPQQPASGPGAQLAAQREARGWTVEQVANQLNMAPRQIQALESDNYGALPGMVIARGFLRAYTKLLKMDPAPLLALVTEQNPAPVEAIELKRTLSATYTEESLPTAKKAASPKWFPLVFLLALLALGWAAYQGGWLHLLSAPEARGDRQAAPSVPPAGPFVTLPPPVSVEQTAPVGEKSPLATPPAAEASAPASATLRQDEKPASVPSTTQATVTTVSQTTVPQTTAPASQAAPAAAATSAAATDNKNGLVLTARQDSWVEIRDARKKVLVSHIIKAGSTESFDVTQPVALTIGNAGGVDATLRGRPLDMKSAKNNVIRLDLK